MANTDTEQDPQIDVTDWSVAAIDTTTLHAVESWHGDPSKRDPWATTCLTTWIDLAVNCEKIYYGAPRLGAGPMDTPIMRAAPLGAAATERGLLELFPGSADDFNPDEDEMLELLNAFNRWAAHHATELKSWLDFCNPRNENGVGFGHLIDMGDKFRYLRDDVWGRALHSNNSALFGSDDNHKFLFTVFARGNQYNRLFGRATPYYAHPIRTEAYIQVQPLGKAQAFWSWGRFLVQHFADEGHVPESDALLDTAVSIRDASRRMGLQWLNLCQVDMTNDRVRADLAEKLYQVATGLKFDGLPEKIKIALDVALILAIAGLDATAGHALHKSLPEAYALAASISAGTSMHIAAIMSRKNINLNFQQTPFVRSRLRFKGLLDEGWSKGKG